MTRTFDRRVFLQTTGAALAATTMAGGSRPLCARQAAAELSTPSAARIGWSVAIAQYTFRGMSFYEALEKIAALGVQLVEPAFFLPLDSKRPDLQINENLSPAQRKETQQRLKDHGVKMPNYYANVTTDAEAAKKVVEFSKEMGVQTIVAEPPPEAFDMVEKLCDEYEINLAVHNHPKSPDYQYWNPENVMAVCKGRSKRIGACCDTGHWIRSELRVTACLKIMEGRILAFHLKDVGEWGKPQSRDVVLGQGLADYADVLRELYRQKFRGVLTVEYEHESDQLMDDVAQCLAFVEKTAKTL